MRPITWDSWDMLTTELFITEKEKLAAGEDTDLVSILETTKERLESTGQLASGGPRF